MKFKFIFLLFFICVISFGQPLAEKKVNISSKTLSTFKYCSNKHQTPSLKFTIITASNKNAGQIIEETDASKMFTAIESGKIVKYNMRVRWRLKNQDRLYGGAETMNSAVKGTGKIFYYIGYRRKF